MIFFKLGFWVKTSFWLVLFFGALIVASDSPAADNKAAWQAHAAKMSAKYDLPNGLLHAICEQETHWRNVVGAAGEIGVCQVQANTVRMICPACDGNAARTAFALGSRGPQVLRIQGVLKSAGYYLGPVDGTFGAGTRVATIAYQQRNTLVADGIVGAKTWHAMFAEPYPGTSIAAALWNPEDNIEWAARYLAWLRDNVSEEPLIMMAAYNGGPANATVRYMLSVGRRLGAV